MLLKSCKVSKKAKSVTSSLVNVRHGSTEDWRKVENAEFKISNSQSFTFMALFHGWGSTALRLQSQYEKAVYFLPLSSQKFLVLI